MQDSQHFPVILDVGLTVFVDNEDITGWFNSSNVDDDADYTGLSITKKNTTQLLVAFKSGRKNVHAKKTIMIIVICHNVND